MGVERSGFPSYNFYWKIVIFEKNEEREIRVFISTVDFAENSLDRKSAKFWTGYMCWLRWEKSKNIFFWAGFIFSGARVVREGYGGSGGPRPNFYWKIVFFRKNVGC